MPDQKRPVAENKLFEKCGGVYADSFLVAEQGAAYLADCPGMKSGKYSALEYIEYKAGARNTHHIDSRQPYMVGVDDSGRPRWLSASTESEGQPGRALQLFGYDPATRTSTKQREIIFEDALKIRMVYRGDRCWLVKATLYGKPAAPAADSYVVYAEDKLQLLEAMPARGSVLFWDRRDTAFVMSDDGGKLFAVDCQGRKRDVRATLDAVLPQAVRAEAKQFFGIAPSPVLAVVYFTVDDDTRTRRLLFVDLRDDSPIELEGVDPEASAIYSATSSASGERIALVFKDSLSIFDVGSKKSVYEMSLQNGMENEVAFHPAKQEFVVFNKRTRELTYLGDR